MKNKYLIHKMANNILNSIENNDSDLNILKYFKVMADQIQDPFVSGIDEFLKEKQEKEVSEESVQPDESQKTEDVQFENQENNPQDEAIDTLKDEALDYKEPVEQDHPQEEAVETLKDEALDYKEPVGQDHPQEEVTEKVIDEISDEDSSDKEESLEELQEKQKNIQDRINNLKSKKEDVHIESSLRNLGLEISKRGYPKIGTMFIMAASEGVLEILNNLLRKEFLIKDIIDNYSYLYTPELVTQLFKYNSIPVIIYLQKQIVNYGGTPTTQRLIIPTVNPAAINPPSIDGIFVLLKEHDADIVSDYIAAINALGNEDKYLTLKVMFSKVIENKTKFMTDLK